MKLFEFAKDGGVESRVFGLFIVEIKKLFSIALLRFKDGSRDAYHNHAFNAISWVIRGRLIERDLHGTVTEYGPSLIPIFTSRSKFHKVVSVGDTWAITFRGSWVDLWNEYLPASDESITLTHTREKLQTSNGNIF